MQRKKIIIFWASISFFLVVGAGILYELTNKTPVEVSVQRNLTPYQRKIYEDRILQGEEVLKSLDSGKPSDKQQLAEIRIYLAQQYYGLGNLSLAEQEYKAALKIYDQHVNAWVGLSTVQIEEKDFATARVSLEKAITYGRDNPDTWIRYIELIVDRFPENQQEVEGYYKEGLEATNRQVDILAKYAQYLEVKGDAQGAAKLWKEAADKESENSAYLQEYNRLNGVQ